MPTLANKRKEYLDETYDEDLNPLGPVEGEEEHTGPPFVGTADRVGALVEPEEYQDNAPFKEVEGYSYTGGSVHPSDPLQRTTLINDQSEGGSNSYGIGEHIKGLGTVEGIDKHGNATILPKSGPKFRLGRSEGRSEGKAEEPPHYEWWRLAAMSRFLNDPPPSRTYEGEEAEEEELDKFSRSVLEPEEEHQYMLDNIYPGLTDKQIDEAVWEDYNNSTEIKGTAFENPDGSFTADYEKPNGEVITIVTYGSPHGYDIPRANITGVAE